MKYRKASEVLPDELLREVQKYVSGETLYIPKCKSRRKWGEDSGAREYYALRNREIRDRYRSGDQPEWLAEEYGLSTESIRRILYEE